MSGSFTNEPPHADEAAAKLPQQRAMSSANDSEPPLGPTSHVDFHASFETARLFAEETGPLSDVQAWMKNSAEVEAMLAVGQAFEPWVTAAKFVYGLYSDWQRKKQEKETAKKIIREVVAAVDAMINRATDNIKQFIKEEEIKGKLDSLAGLQRSLVDHMTLSLDGDFGNIEIDFVSRFVTESNELLSFFERTFYESVKASNSAQAAVMYEHIVETTQLKNQTLAWKDQTLPHGSSSLARQGVLRLQDLLNVLLPAARKTTNKQFSGIKFQQILLDNGGGIIRPHLGPKPPVGKRINLFFYYFRGEAQGPLVTVGIKEEQFIGSTKQAEVRKAIEKHKEEEYLKATENLRAMGDENKKALDDLDPLIKEEALTAAPNS